MFQSRQFEQGLREAADLVALRQGDGQVALALGGVERGVLQRQRFQVAVQRRQRRAQVVGNVGHQFAALQVLLAQLLPLLAEALRHVREAVPQDRQFVALAGPGRRRWRRQRGRGGIDVECLDVAGQPAQRTGNPAEGGRDVRGQRFALLADQDHVDVTHLLPLHAQGRGVEHLAPGTAARVVAEDGQGRAAQQRMDRRQVDPVAPEVAIRRVVAEDSALVIEQVDLDAGVDRHQLAEQGADLAIAHAACVHQFAAARDVFGQPARKALHGFLLVQARAAHLDPRQRAAAHQQQRAEHQRQPLPQREPLHASLPPAASL